MKSHYVKSHEYWEEWRMVVTSVVCLTLSSFIYWLAHVHNNKSLISIFWPKYGNCPLKMAVHDDRVSPVPSIVCVYVCMSMRLLSRVRLFATPWTAACQASLSMVFPRQEYWSGLSFPPLGDLFDPEIKPTSLGSPALAGGFFTISATWEAPSTIKLVFEREISFYLVWVNIILQCILQQLNQKSNYYDTHFVDDKIKLCRDKEICPKSFVI